MKISPNLATFATENNRPCSSFVAAFARDRLGLSPSDPTDIDSWYSLDPPLWRAVNLWGGVEQLGSNSNIYFLKDKLGGSIFQVDALPLPLSNGVYIVQRWCGANGHSYLLEVLPNNKVILIDSDTSNGLTFTEKTTTNWFQPGCQHTLLKLQKKNHLFKQVGLAILIIYAITQ